MTDKNLVTEFLEELKSMPTKPDQKLITTDIWNDLKREQIKVSQFHNDNFANDFFFLQVFAKSFIGPY